MEGTKARVGKTKGKEKAAKTLVKEDGSDSGCTDLKVQKEMRELVLLKR